MTDGETPAEEDLPTEEAAVPLEPEPAEAVPAEPKSPEPGYSHKNAFLYYLY